MFADDQLRVTHWTARHHSRAHHARENDPQLCCLAIRSYLCTGAQHYRQREFCAELGIAVRCYSVLVGEVSFRIFCFKHERQLGEFQHRFGGTSFELKALQTTHRLFDWNWQVEAGSPDIGIQLQKGDHHVHVSGREGACISSAACLEMAELAL